MIELGFLLIYNPREWTVGFAAVSVSDETDEDPGSTNVVFSFRFLMFGLDFSHFTRNKTKAVAP